MASERPTGTVQYNNAGRVVIVTGGCSGIGHTICELFARSEAEGVVCADVNEAAAKDLPDTKLSGSEIDSIIDQVTSGQLTDWTPTPIDAETPGVESEAIEEDVYQLNRNEELERCRVHSRLVLQGAEEKGVHVLSCTVPMRADRSWPLVLFYWILITYPHTMDGR